MKIFLKLVLATQSLSSLHFCEACILKYIKSSLQKNFIGIISFPLLSHQTLRSGWPIDRNLAFLRLYRSFQPGNILKFVETLVKLKDLLPNNSLQILTNLSNKKMCQNLPTDRHSSRFGSSSGFLLANLI